MRELDERFVVTGGLGFIGRHLIRALVGRRASVVVIDREDRIPAALGPLASDSLVSVVRGDLRTLDLGGPLAECTGVFHLAAGADVRTAEADPRGVFEDNVLVTARILDAMAAAGVARIGFPSTSTVYGEAPVPTREDAPLAPVSVYGATKVAGEGLLHGFAAEHEVRAVVWRFANVVGGGATHGVTYDFFQRLRANPKELQIMGREPGTRKSYVHVDDAVRAMLSTWENAQAGVTTFNVGSEDAITVREVADAVCRGMGLFGVRYRWSGGVDGGGWRGDVKTMQLAVDRLKAIGWRSRHRSAESVYLAAMALAEG